MLLGADPEFFVIDENYQVVNASEVIPYSKKRPLEISCCKIYYDNILVEINPNPAKTEDQFLHNILSSFNEVLLRIKPYRLSLQSFADIDITKIKNKNVFEIGCNPDLNAYKMSYNRVPRKLYKTSGFRASGGHIHIGGYPDDAINDPFLKPIFVYMLDLFLGVPSVIMDCSVDSYKRRKIYGKAGSYRPKSYGIEYRVLSPFWLQSSNTIRLIYRICEFVFDFMNEGLYKKFWNIDEQKIGNKNNNFYSCFGYDENAIIKTINECDYSLARSCYKFISNFLPEDIIDMIDEEINTKKDDIKFYSCC